VVLRIDDRFDMAGWDEMEHFIARTHGAHHVMRDRSLFEWFYCRDPSHPGMANVVVARDDSELVAILGYVPTAFLYAGERVQGTWTALWFALPEHRHGVGALLMRRLAELFAVVAGQGASEMNRAIVKAMGHSFVDTIPKVVLVLDRTAINEWLPEYVVPPWRPAMRRTSHGAARTLAASSYSPEWRHYPDLEFSTVRDFEHLHDRYVAYPFMEYEVLVLGEPETPSVAVLRVIDSSAGVRVGRLLEFFGPDIRVFGDQSSALLDQVVAQCRSRGCGYIDFYCTSADSVALLQAYGFVRDDAGELPSLLDPVDFSRRRQNLECYVSPGLRPRLPDWHARLYASRGDGDQDRPNAAYAAEMRIGL
jgi:hypothetical protein